FIDGARELLLHQPGLQQHGALTGIHSLTVWKDRLYRPPGQCRRQGQARNVGPDRRGVAVVDHRVGVQVPAVKYEIVADGPAVAEGLLELGAKIAQVAATTVADVVVR